MNLHISQTGPWGALWLSLFDYPLNLHISQTSQANRWRQRRFDYPLNLHISQTRGQALCVRCLFDYPLNLHISQTCWSLELAWQVFDYPLNLHISQTIQQQHPEYDSLIILWIYISLKRQKLHRRLLSVWLSFEFTYLSNEHYQNLHSRKFDYPLNLHISQTKRMGVCELDSLIILWIYISLKPQIWSTDYHSV